MNRIVKGNEICNFCLRQAHPLVHSVRYGPICRPCWFWQGEEKCNVIEIYADDLRRRGMDPLAKELIYEQTDLLTIIYMAIAAQIGLMAAFLLLL